VGVVAPASSGLAVSINASGVGMVTSGGSGSAAVQMTSGTGTAAVTFNQAGDTNYNPATLVEEDVTAQKANQTITVTQAAPGAAQHNTSFTVSATASSGLPVGIAASGASSGSGSGSATITMTGTSGTGTVTFSEAGDSNYNPATMVAESVAVGVIGPGLTLVGNTLYAVGGSNTNDQVQIIPAGSSNTGSTGVQVTANLGGGAASNTYNVSTVYIVGFNGNDSIRIASTLTISTIISLG